MMDEKQAVTVTTLDGDEASSENAMSLNYGRVAMARKSARDPEIKSRLSAMLEAMREKGPGAYCVASVETPKAKQLAAILDGIKLPKPKDEGREAPAVWVSYATALEGWEKFKASREKPAESPSEPVDLAAEAKAKAEADARKRAETAAALDALIPADVKADRDERSAEKKARDAETEKLEELIGPIVHGLSCVDSNKQPSFLKVNGREFPISYFEDILAGSLIEPEVARVRCVFCGEEHAVGDQALVFVRKENKKVMKFVMRQIAVPVRTEDGTNEYIRMGGDKKGELKKMYLVVCHSCGSIAVRLSPQMKDPKDSKRTMPSVLPRDLCPSLMRYTANRSHSSEPIGSVLGQDPERGLDAIKSAAQARQEELSERKGKTPAQYVAETEERHLGRDLLDELDGSDETPDDGPSAVEKFRKRQSKRVAKRIGVDIDEE